jgi:hypothetical protein
MISAMTFSLSWWAATSRISDRSLFKGQRAHGARIKHPAEHPNHRAQLARSPAALFYRSRACMLFEKSFVERLSDTS